MKNPEKKILKRYKENCEKAGTYISGLWELEIPTESNDIEEGDGIIIKVDSKAYRGSAEYYIHELLILLEATIHYGIDPTNTTMSYFVTWGNAASGVIVINGGTILNTEVSQ